MVKSPSKKHAKLTLVKFNVLTMQEKPIGSNNTNSTTSNIFRVRSSVNTSSAGCQNSSSKVFYHTKKPNEDLDMSTFCSSLVEAYSFRNAVLDNPSVTALTWWSRERTIMGGASLEDSISPCIQTPLHSHAQRCHTSTWNQRYGWW